MDDAFCAAIRVRLSEVTQGAHGAVVGPIWIAGGESGGAFPEASWSDFPLVLLASWIPSLRRLVTQGQAAECRFIDGPYHFTVGAAAPEEWRVACFEHREGPSAANAVAEWRTTPSVFLGSALVAARGILGYCDKRQWWNPDTDRLRTVIATADPSAV